MDRLAEQGGAVRQLELNFNFGEKIWRVGTRDGELALRKTEAALAYCKSRDPKFQYRLVTTAELREAREWSFEVRVSASSLSAEARLRSELKMLEEALTAQDIDFFADDLAQLPLRCSDRLQLAAVLPRKDVRELLIVPKGKDFAALPAGASVGAYGQRRAFLLGLLRADLLVQQSRESLNQALDRVTNGDYAAFIAPAMDLLYTELAPYKDKLSFFPFSVQIFCPAPGQGLLGLFCAAEGGEKTAQSLRTLADDAPARAAYLCETRIARKLLGVQVDAQRQAAAYLYYDTDGTAHLRAVNTLSAQREPLQVDMPLAYRGRSAIEEDLEQAAFKSLLGKIALVGAGPGTPELLTLRALELLKMADVVVFDDPSSGALLSRASAVAEQIYIDPAVAGGKSLLPPGEKVCRLLMDRARRGKNVVRLSGGDPWLMDHAAAEALRLSKAKMTFELVPGVSAALAAPAYAGIPVTLNGLASSVHILDGRAPFADAPGGVKDFRSLVRLGGTLIFMMAVANLPELCSGLLQGGCRPEQQCALISDAGLATQRVVLAPLGQMAARAVLENILPPASFIVGPSVELAEKLRWWPPMGVLSGKMIVIGKSRQNDRYAQQLKLGVEGRGANAVELALVEHSTTEPVAARMDRDFMKVISAHEKLRRPEKCQLWLVFTSGIAVEAMHACLTRLSLDVRRLARCKIAAYGMGTLAALRDFGFNPDFVPEVPDLEHLTNGLAERLSKDDLVVQVRGTLAAPLISVVMQMKGIAMVDLIAYETHNHLPGREALLQLLEDIHYFVFTSPTAVHAFFESLNYAGILSQSLERMPIRLIPALPACAQALQARGFAKDSCPAEYSEQGILNYLTDLVGEERERDEQSQL